MGRKPAVAGSVAKGAAKKKKAARVFAGGEIPERTRPPGRKKLSPVLNNGPSTRSLRAKGKGISLQELERSEDVSDGSQFYESEGYFSECEGASEFSTTPDVHGMASGAEIKRYLARILQDARMETSSREIEKDSSLVEVPICADRDVRLAGGLNARGGHGAGGRSAGQPSIGQGGLVGDQIAPEGPGARPRAAVQPSFGQGRPGDARQPSIGQGGLVGDQIAPEGPGARPRAAVQPSSGQGRPGDSQEPPCLEGSPPATGHGPDSALQQGPAPAGSGSSPDVPSRLSGAAPPFQPAGPPLGAVCGAAPAPPLPPPPPGRGAWAEKIQISESANRFDLIRLPQQQEGRPLRLDDDLIEEEGKWKALLVGFFPGTSMPFHAIRAITQRAWKGAGLSSVQSVESGFFLFQFDSEAQAAEVMARGPWMFGGKNFVLQRWSPHLTFDRSKISRVPVWVRLYGLPFPFWSTKALSKVASMLGTPLSCDKQTFDKSRLSFARVCVELDAAREPVFAFDIECSLSSKPVRVSASYQWLPKRCPSCSVFGHVCPAPPQPPPPASEAEARGTQAPMPQEGAKEAVLTGEEHPPSNLGGDRKVAKEGAVSAPSEGGHREIAAKGEPGPLLRASSSRGQPEAVNENSPREGVTASQWTLIERKGSHKKQARPKCQNPTVIDAPHAARGGIPITMGGGARGAATSPSGGPPQAPDRATRSPHARDHPLVF